MTNVTEYVLTSVVSPIVAMACHCTIFSRRCTLIVETITRTRVINSWTIYICTPSTSESSVKKLKEFLSNVAGRLCVCLSSWIIIQGPIGVIYVNCEDRKFDCKPIRTNSCILHLPFFATVSFP